MENPNETVLLTWIGSYLPRGGELYRALPLVKMGVNFHYITFKGTLSFLYEIINKGQLQNVPIEEDSWRPENLGIECS